MGNLLRELKTSSLFQVPIFVCMGALSFALAAWLLKHLCLTPWFFGALCLALASAGWAIVHPLDHYLRSYRKLDLSISARYAFGSAIAISAFSSMLFFRLSSVPVSGCERSSFIKPRLPALPKTSKDNRSVMLDIKPPLPPREDESYAKTIEWRQWHANIWNAMFLGDSNTGLPAGTTAEYKFDVTRDGQILNTNVQSTSPAWREYVMSKINSLPGSDVLNFPAGSNRDKVSVQDEVKVCYPNEDPRCGMPSEGRPDDEKIRLIR